MKKIICFLAFCLLGHVALAQNRKVDLKENLPFGEVLAMAQKSNKYIFLDFGSLSCPPCMFIKKNVLTVDSVADYINARFVSVDYNDGEEKKRLQDVYNVIGEPVLLILDSKGKLMHRMAGLIRENEILPLFRQGLDIENNLVALDKKYENGKKDEDFLIQYVEALSVAKNTEHMSKVAKEILSGPLENLKKEKYWNIFYKYDADIASRQMLHVFNNRQEFYKLFGQEEIEKKFDRLYDLAAMYYLASDASTSDPKLLTIIDNLRKTDYPKASEWLASFLLAQYKGNWIKTAQEVNNIFSYNILKGKNGEHFKQTMIVRYMLYCNQPEALKYALKWCDDVERGENFKKKLLKKIENPEAEKLDWKS